MFRATVLFLGSGIVISHKGSRSINLLQVDFFLPFDIIELKPQFPYYKTYISMLI